MRVNLVAYSSLRNHFDPRPAIGETIEIEVERGETIRDILSRFFPNVNEVSIIMVNGNHKSMDFQINEEGLKIAVFPASGGG